VLDRFLFDRDLSSQVLHWCAEVRLSCSPPPELHALPRNVALNRIGELVSESKAPFYLDELLVEDDPEFQGNALLALLETRPDSIPLARIRELCRSANPITRIAANGVLALRGDGTARDELLRSARNESHVVLRALALRCLAKLDDVPAELFIDALRSDTESFCYWYQPVTTEAMIALGWGSRVTERTAYHELCTAYIPSTCDELHLPFHWTVESWFEGRPARFGSPWYAIYLDPNQECGRKFRAP
ncbi:MAG: HEAT repeat domain-containing protein, partial [Planctomycetota bacterium]